MALQGTIESFGISEIFQLISHQGKSGTLEIETGEGTARLRFLDGKLVEAWPDRRNRTEYIGVLLVRAGLITEGQLQHALDKQRQGLHRLGDILVRMGAVRLNDFRRMLTLQHQETFYRVLRLKRGKFRFLSELVEVEDGVSVLLEMEGLLMEGFRQVDEWPRLREKIPSERRVFGRVLDAESPPDLEPDVARVLELVDGTTPVRTVVDRARLGEFRGWECLVDLYDRGLITPVRTALRAPAEPRVRKPRPWVDAAVAAVLAGLAASIVAWMVATGAWTGLGLGRAVGDARQDAARVAARSRSWVDTGPARWPGR